MSPNDGLETLVNHLHDTPPIVLSILQLFKVTKPFVAGIYHYPDKKQYPSSDFVEDWQDFIDRYAILEWETRKICMHAGTQVDKLLDVLAFATQDEPNFPVVMAKVEDYMRIPDTTPDDSLNHADELKKLDFNVQEWKVKVFYWIDKNVPKKDDGTSTYRMLMNDLKNLKDHLPPDPQPDSMKNVWLHNITQPVTVSTERIQGTWREVWNEARLIVGNIRYAKDSATLKGLRITLQKAASDYKTLSNALNDYSFDLAGRTIATDLYWAYKSATDRGKHY